MRGRSPGLRGGACPATLSKPPAESNQDLLRKTKVKGTAEQVGISSSDEFANTQEKDKKEGRHGEGRDRRTDE